MGAIALDNAQLLNLLPWLAGSVVGGMFLLLAAVATRPANAEAAEELANDDQQMFGSWTSVLAYVLPDVLPYKARRDLLRSGYYRPAAYDNYLALRNFLVMGVLLTGGCWLVAVAENETLTLQLLGGTLIAAVFAYSLPRLYLSWFGERRSARVLLGLPDALDVIVMGIAGGLPLQQALDRASGELHDAHPDLSDELKIIRRQAAVGSLGQAFVRFGERMDQEEITTLAAMIRHAEQTGANVGSLLLQHADNVRQTRMRLAQERSNRLSIQMLFPLVLCLGPAAFIMLLTPPLMDLQRFRDEESQEGGILAQPKAINGAARSPAGRSNAPVAPPR